MEWIDHPFTRKTLKACQERLEAAEIELDSACEKSTDPRVRAAWNARYSLRVVMAIFKEKKRVRDELEDDSLDE